MVIQEKNKCKQMKIGSKTANFLVD